MITDFIGELGCMLLSKLASSIFHLSSTPEIIVMLNIIHIFSYQSNRLYDIQKRLYSHFKSIKNKADFSEIMLTTVHYINIHFYKSQYYVSNITLWPLLIRHCETW
jgi:hypothetical protein